MGIGMRRKSLRQKKRNPGRYSQQIEWLPFDSRLIPDIFSFSHVKGIARIFLIVEMVLSVLVVSGSIGLALFAVLIR
jgi:hypothetical protein